MSDDAEAAFGAVADELRIRILRALWEADDPLSFSALRERVDVDDSGRFNYHLGKLRGRFVEQTADGYELRFAGSRLVGALYSGVFTEEASVGPVPVDGTCTNCGGDLEASYEDERGRVDCTNCDVVLLSGGVPPAFVDDREDDLATALDGYFRTMLREVRAGFCTQCSGPVAGRLEHDTDHGRCSSASAVAGRSAGLRPPSHSTTAVVSFYYEHGLDVRTVPNWEVDWLHDATDDGDAARVAVALDGDELELVVDESLAVSTAERA